MHLRQRCPKRGTLPMVRRHRCFANQFREQDSRFVFEGVETLTLMVGDGNGHRHRSVAQALVELDKERHLVKALFFKDLQDPFAAGCYKIGGVFYAGLDPFKVCGRGQIEARHKVR